VKRNETTLYRCRHVFKKYWAITAIYSVIFSGTVSCAWAVGGYVRGVYLKAVALSDIIEASGEALADIYAEQEEQREIIDSILANTENMQRIRAKVTAYTMSRDETDSTPKMTATQRQGRPGRTASVSKDLIYLVGKEIYIPGLGVWTVDDVPKPGDDTLVDLMVGTKERAREIGVSVREICVL